MKKVLFTLLAFGLASSAAMAQDDVYFVPTKKAIQKERQSQRQAQQWAATDDYESTYAPLEGYDHDTWADYRVNGSMDVDTYNRRGNGLLVATNDSVEVDTVAVDGYYGSDEDYSATGRIVRFRSPRASLYASPYYDDYYYDLGYYDPWYYSTWYDMWYDPWYYGGYYGGWMNPWHYSGYWGWGHYGYYGHYGWGWDPCCYWGGPHGWDHYYWNHCWGWTNSGWGNGWTQTGRSNGRLSGHNFSRGGTQMANRGTTSGTRGTATRGGRSTGTSYSGTNNSGTRTFNNGRGGTTSSRYGAGSGSRYSGSSATGSRTTTGGQSYSRGGSSSSRSF
ncbi:MAG: hypothetical protein Q4D23_11105, partial [Bacteroidales bacterium]|nr:hypothetical protein [Bacteroidales bacterium]